MEKELRATSRIRLRYTQHFLMNSLGVYIKIEYVLNFVEKWVKAKPDNKQLKQVRDILLEAFAVLNNKEKQIIELRAEVSALERKLAQYKSNLLKFTNDEVS